MEDTKLTLIDRDFQEKKIAKLWKKWQICIKRLTKKEFSILKKAPISESVHSFYGDWNQGYDWLI